MTKYIVGKRQLEVTVEMLWSGVSPGFQVGALSSADKRALGYATTTPLYIRQDGGRADLVKMTNGYTSFVARAQVSPIQSINNWSNGYAKVKHDETASIDSNDS